MIKVQDREYTTKDKVAANALTFAGYSYEQKDLQRARVYECVGKSIIEDTITPDTGLRIITAYESFGSAKADEYLQKGNYSSALKELEKLI